MTVDIELVRLIAAEDLLGKSHRHAFVFRHGWDWCECGAVEPVFECAP